MKRYDILKELIKKRKYKKYLEIGVRAGETFNKIDIDKIGVDPNCSVPGIILKTSDEFFKSNKLTFDLIFIDGLHEKNQVLKDIENSLKFLNKGGVIVCHDLNPVSEIAQRYPQPQGESTWNGDCWKAWVELRMKREDLKMYVINTDHGCGIIERGKQKVISFCNLNYSEFNKNRVSWLNLISVKDFKIS